MYDYDLADKYEDKSELCPLCSEGYVNKVGCESYGSDRDGNRGVSLSHYACTNPDCDYEGERFGC